MADVTPKTIKEDQIVWNSSNENVASVKNGVVTGLNAGKVKITCMTKDGSIVATKEITVKDAYDSSAFIVVNNTDSSIKYGAGSKAGAGGDSYIKFDETLVGEYAEFTFEGSGIRIIGATNIDLGMAKIYLDGKEVAVIDCYSSQLYTRQAIFEKLDLDYGTHSVKIVPTSTKNESSKGVLIAVDAIAYIPLVEAEKVFVQGDSEMTVGETAALSAGIVPMVNTIKQLVWESSDASVISVDSEGNVTAHKAGNAVVTVKIKDNDMAAAIKITVTDISEDTNPKDDDTAIRPNDTEHGGRTALFIALAMMAAALSVGVIAVLIKVFKKKKTNRA